MPVKQEMPPVPGSFFEYYLNHLLPLKREWYREKKNVTFLSTDGLTARQAGEKVKQWCEQYI